MSRRWRTLRTLLVLAVTLFGYTAVFDPAFDAWKTEFRAYALTQGIRAEVLDLAMRNVFPDPKVLRLDTHQPEFSKTVWEYLDSAASPLRIQMGRRRFHEYHSLLTQIHQRYGVQPEYLLAIWGLESDYGRFTGRYDIVRSLATLAYEGQAERREFWREQLVSALRIVQQGDMSLRSLRGSWAGAIGHTQFMPTTFEKYAVDFDGDGRRDLSNSIPDALASTANYLANSGWERDQPWGEEVSIPDDFDWSKADPNYWLPTDVWMQESGIRKIDGSQFTHTDSAFVFLPAGYLGPKFLVYNNFNAILQYNNAQTYALAVGYLGDRIRGMAAIVAAWPRNELPLNTAEKAELQQLLTGAGYSTDGVDGRIGPNTRAALRRWQLETGFPADGYATLEHLQFLREETAGRDEATAP